MSEPIYSDPAAPERGGVGVSAPGPSATPTPAAAAAPRIGLKVVRRWWLIVLCTALGVAGSFVYLATAAKTYTARCVLAAELDGGGPGGGVAPDEFLFQQRDLIHSPPVLAAAATTMVQSEPRVREAVEVLVSKGEGVFTIAYAASEADEAARGARAVTDAYLRTRSQQQTSTTAGLTALTRQRDKLTADRAAREAAIRELRQAAGTGGDAERAAAARLDQLKQAVAAAEVEAKRADDAAVAARDVVADPVKLRAVVDANRGKGIFDRLETQRTQVESEVAQAESQLEKQRQSMLPQHPVVIATRAKIDQLKSKLAELDRQYAEVYAAHVGEQRAAAQQRVDELKRLVSEQAAQAKDYTVRAAKLAEVEAEAKKVDAAIAEVDGKIRDATLSTGASSAPIVRVVVPAEAPRRPTRPDRDRTVLIGAIIGLAAGLLLAAVVPARRNA